MFKLYKNAWLSMCAPHKNIFIGKKDCHDLLKKGGFLIRNDFNFDTQKETNFWYVIKDNFGDLEELSSGVRNKIRRAKNTLEIRIIEKELMLSFGYNVLKEATTNYKVKSELSTYKDYIKRIENYDNSYQFWGCIIKESGELIAFSINHIYDGICNYDTFKANPIYLRGYYPFYGLFYEMNRYYLQERKLLYVCDGARTITEHSNIQSFLIEKFKFRKAYCDLHLEYIWWMKLTIASLFPLRSIIKNNKIKALLNLESMSRCNK